MSVVFEYFGTVQYGYKLSNKALLSSHLFLIYDFVFFLRVVKAVRLRRLGDLGENPVLLALECVMTMGKGRGETTYSLSRKSWYSSSPTLTGEPPN